MLRISRGILAALAAASLFAGPWRCRAESHAALGSRVELSVPINPRYPGSAGAATLADGITGSLSYGKEWLGFEGPDVEITVHLPVATPVRALAADFLQVTAPAIFLPVSVDFAVSVNGENFRTVATVLPQADEKTEGPLLERFQVSGLDLTVTAVRVRAANGGNVPPWHRSPQALRWTFVSEVLVNPGDVPISAADLLKAYRVGTSRWPLTRLEEQLRQSSGEERRTRCAELASLLGADDVTTEAKLFCLEQLARFGTTENVALVVPLLANSPLASAAGRTLAQLGGAAAETALLSAAGQGAETTRGAALAALAALHSPRAVELAALLEDDALHAVAASALAAAGTPAAAEALASALARAPEGRRLVLAAALLSCADALLDKGEGAAADTAFAAVETVGPGPLQRLASLAGRVRAGHPDRLADVFEVAAKAEPALARSALSLGAELVVRLGPGPLAARFASLPPTAQAAVVQAVGRRAMGDEEAWLLACLASPAVEVRTAAAVALPATASNHVVLPLARLLSAEDKAEVTAAIEALAGLEDGRCGGAILEAAHAATGSARVPFCSVLERRRNTMAAGLLLQWGRDDDDELRRAAWKALAALLGEADLPTALDTFRALPATASADAAKALLAAARSGPATEKAAGYLAREALAVAPTDTHRAVLLGVLGSLGGPAAEKALSEHLKHAAPEIRAAAARALGAWADAGPAEALLAAAAVEPDERVAVLCLRSALELLKQHGEALPPEQVGTWLSQAAGLIRRDEEHQLLLEAAAASPCLAGLDLVAKALTTPALAPRAETALLKLAPALWPDAPSAMRAALEQVAAAAQSEETRKHAAALLGLLPGTEALKRIETAAWVPWFDGKSLDGWRIVGGRPDAWVARDGLLVAQAGGGGWLATVKEYTDYLVEFEFRLPPDGNSGLFLRPPLEGNPAWEGIEVQLLDDAAPQYAKLRPDQYCASIYGIAAATPRVSRPAGEWQRLRVLCQGRRVAVWLNGVNVANADLDQHLAQADKLRGLTRATGYPGLQNEHGPIEFRNLRLKNLAP